jgi:peptidoglycan hydrolase-like protein with peptidoglycan-binding domain
MQARGWAIHVDGLFGVEDETICKKFQAEKHLTVDGKVGHVTWDHARHDPVT